jgi:CheY-like chemotaxis protein
VPNVYVVPIPLILAVEPDEHQASQLSAMFKRQFRAELVMARSVSVALEKMAGRVPDLVLMSALVPARGEAAMMAWLRKLGPAGAHVQTVTIPVLARTESQSRAKSGSGTFSFAREATTSAPDSCDPAVFADWITIYLDLASSHLADSH